MSQKSRFFDGKTANPYELEVILSKEKLIGKTLSEDIFLEWNINDIRIINEPENDRAAVITNHTDNATRLYIETSIFQKLEPLLSKKARPVFRVSTSAKSIFFFLAIAALIVFLIFQAVPRFAPYIAQKFPQEWEESLGNYAFNLLAGEKKICTSKDSQQSLEKMLSVLNAQDNMALEIFVIEDKAVNAFAAPGGKIVFYSGLIKKSESPSEVAGVMAHEMGHILKKHPTEGLVRSLGFTLIAQLMFGNVGSIGDAGIIGQILLELNYSRNAEREADKIALRLLQENHIDPKGFQDFFKRLQEEEININADILTYFSTHPKTSERIDTISDKEKDREYKSIISEDEWEALKNICDDI